MTVPIVGLGPNDFVPGVYIQPVIPAGTSGGTTSTVTACLLGNALASSYVTTNSLFDGYVFGPNEEGNFAVSSESDVTDKFGVGSELHRMYRQFVRVNGSSTPVSFVAVKESTGSAATLTITFTGTASSVGSFRSYIGDEFIDAGVISGDTPTVIATSVANAINSVNYRAVSALASSGTVVLTAKQKGLRGNSIRVACQAQGSFGTTSSAQNFAYLSGGTTADVWTTALSTIFPRHFSYIASAGEDASPSGDVGLLVAQVATQALPINGNRQLVISGFNGSIGTAITNANGFNSIYNRYAWEKNSNYTPAENAAYLAGSVCLAETSTSPRLNFNNLGTTTETAALWDRSAPFDGTTITRADIVSALSNGISPVVRRAIGKKSMLVQLLTTYSKDPTNSSNSDFRARHHHKVTVLYIAADRIGSGLSQNFSNSVSADEPAQGQRPPPAQVVIPSVVSAFINKVIFDMGEEGLLQKVDLSMSLTQVNRETTPNTRFGCLVQLFPVDTLDQFGVKLLSLN